jgi:hypothetical protein
MAVPGTSVTVDDPAGAAAILFVTETSPENVRALRYRVRHMATTLNHESVTKGTREQSGVGAKEAMDVPASVATVNDIPGGARLELVPLEPTRLESLRQHVRIYATQMAEASCHRG